MPDCLKRYFIFQEPSTEDESQPEVTTPEKPETVEYKDDDEGESNIAISTAIARQGQYYVLQPNGKLQKVTYRTTVDPKNKSSPIISNLKYEYVSPIKDPIYSYQNGQLVRIN